MHESQCCGAKPLSCEAATFKKVLVEERKVEFWSALCYTHMLHSKDLQQSSTPSTPLSSYLTDKRRETFLQNLSVE
jgi:hypothetical protein